MSGLGRELAGLGQHRFARQIERRGVSAVAIDNAQAGVAAPDRHRQPVEHPAHGSDFGKRRAVRLLGAPQRRQIGQPHHAFAARRPAALDLVGRAAGARNRRRESRALVFQIIERGGDPCRIFGL